MVHLPYFVEVIRCSEKFAVISAPEEQNAYLLKKGNPNPNIGDEMFFFYSKFCFHLRNYSPKEISERIGYCNSHQVVDDDKMRAGENKTSTTTPPPHLEYESPEEFGFLSVLKKNGDGDWLALLDTELEDKAREESEPSKLTSNHAPGKTDTLASPIAESHHEQRDTVKVSKSVSSDLPNIVDSSTPSDLSLIHISEPTRPY